MKFGLGAGENKRPAKETKGIGYGPCGWATVVGGGVGKV